jgi:hypothetical protein
MDNGFFADDCNPEKDKTKWNDIPKKRWPVTDDKNHFVEYTIIG